MTRLIYKIFEKNLLFRPIQLPEAFCLPVVGGLYLHGKQVSVMLKDEVYLRRIAGPPERR